MWEEFSDKEDLIRRQDMIESILFATADGDKADWIIGVIKSVPSVQKTGHWDDSCYMQRCSVCGGRGKKSYKYCPYCGSRNRGEEE